MLSRNGIRVAALLLLGLVFTPLLHAQSSGAAFQDNLAQTGQPNDASVNGKISGGSPILIATGNTVEPETDFASRGQMGLFLNRTYNNYWSGIDIFGKNWLSNFDYKLEFNTSSPTGTCYPKPGATCATPPTNVTTFWALRPDGRQIEYDYNSTQSVWWEKKTSPISHIVRNADSTYTLYGENHSVEHYSASGYMLSIANEQGVGWTFTYDANNYLQRVTHTSGRYVQFTWIGNQLTRVTDPQGNPFNYTYLANRAGTGLNLLATTTLPGTWPTTVTYYYEDSRFPFGLTGKDYSGTRYSTIAYDSAGRAILSRHGTGTMDQYSYVYTPGSGNALSVVETNPLGRTTTYQFVNGLIQSVTGTGGTNVLNTYKEHTYDANGYDSLVADFNGNITQYTYAANGQLQQKVEAYNTPAARTTQYQWDPDPTRNRPIKITVVGVNETDFSYDTLARLASVTIKNLSANGVPNQTHTTTYSYTTYPNGIIASITVDGPLPGTGDAVVSNFSASGDLTSVSNSLGQTTTYSVYNGLGEAGHVVGVNGATSDTTYDAQGRVLDVRTYPNGVAADTIYSYDYANSNLLTAITTPDGVTQNYTFDATRHLLAVGSSSGTIQQEEDYSYNAMGDVIATADRNMVGNFKDQCTRWWKDGEGYMECLAWTQVWQPAGTVVRSASKSYDGLGRLWTVGGNNSQNFRTNYDTNNNPGTATDSLNRVTTLSYDAFNRATKSVDAKGGITQYAYDTAGNLIKVIDPRGLVTTYVYDGFGQLWAQSSPDSGTTSFTYNAYGQRIAMTRANGQGTGYGYDSLGRIAAISAGGQTQTFTYDACSNGQGHVCQVTDPSGQLNDTYTPEGHLLTQTQKIGTDPLNLVTGYAYDAMGHVTGVSYPSGVSVGYGYANGKLTTMTTTINGVTTTVANNIQYQPYGPATGWTYGNGLTRSLNYDLDGRLTALATVNGSTNLQSLSYSLDANNSITGIANGVNTTQSQTYWYDELTRLTNVGSAGGNWAWALDAVGNRTSQSGPAGGSGYYPSNISNNYWGTDGVNARGFTFDALGNRTGQTGSLGTFSYLYDPFNRMQSATNNGVTTHYLVNALGQRVRKDQGTAATTTGYVYGEGNAMLAEYSWSGSGWKSYLWLGGQLIGVVRNNTLYYVHPDHLSRPEIGTDGAKNIVWRANNYAFDRTVTLDTIGGLNLGFPGQYYDAETRLWNNGFRDYDASVGRYVESDPIGLMGGINTFAYVGGNPISVADQTGLDPYTWIGELGELTHEGVVRIGGGGLLILGSAYGGYYFGTYIANPAINWLTSKAAGRDTTPGALIYDVTHPEKPWQDYSSVGNWITGLSDMLLSQFVQEEYSSQAAFGGSDSNSNDAPGGGGIGNTGPDSTACDIVDGIPSSTGPIDGSDSMGGDVIQPEDSSLYASPSFEDISYHDGIGRIQ